MLKVKHLGLTDYEPVFRDMQAFTKQRQPHSQDELWFTEHRPVFTQGLNGKPEHLLQASDIPVVKTDRGGQITYHAPGQLIGYFLINLIRKKIGVRQCVTQLENSIIRLLQQHNIDAYAKPDAPGVYVKNAKIAALGLKIRKGCSYHGISLNNSMDLTPFSYINPCGFQGLAVTQLKDLKVQLSMQQLADQLLPHIKQEFSYES